MQKSARSVHSSKLQTMMEAQSASTVNTYNTQSTHINRVKDHRRMKRGLEDFNPDEYLEAGLTTQDILDLKEVYDEFDMNKDGLVSPLDLRAALAMFDVRANKKTTFTIISQYDDDELGELDFRSFLKIAVSRRKVDSRRNVYKTFQGLSRGKRKKYITAADLKRVSKQLGDAMSDKEAKEIVEQKGRVIDGEHVLTFQDFEKAMNEF